MSEPRRRKASEMPPYRHTADRLADLEETCQNLTARVVELEAKIAELERKWQEDHTTLYVLLHQHIEGKEEAVRKLQAK